MAIAHDLANNPPLAIGGEAGETWTNTTAKVMYQAHCQFNRSCARCIQWANRIGPWWPFPLHPGCVCQNVPVAPGHTARPFLNYEDEMAKLSPAEQTRAMGKSNWQLIQSGTVEWSDVVTRGRIRPLAEVVERQKLSLGNLTGAGIPPGRAQQALAAQQQAQVIAGQAAQQAYVAQLRGYGLSDDDIKRALRERLRGRFGLSSPSPGAGPQRIIGVMPTPAPPKPVTPSPPQLGPARAAVTFDTPEAETLAAAGKLLGRPVTAQQLASLAGAPHDADVAVNLSPHGHVYASVTSPHMHALRAIRRDEAGVYIDNIRAEVGEGYRGAGRGLEMFSRQVQAASEAGVTRIDTEATRSHDANGYFVWPLFGYDGPIPSDLLTKLPAALADARNVSDLFKTAEGMAWWKTHGQTVPLTFDLAPGSPSMRALDAYRKRKAKGE